MAQPETRSFVSVLRSPVTPFDSGKTIAKSANCTKKGNCFEECNVLATEKCELSAKLRLSPEQSARPP